MLHVALVSVYKFVQHKLDGSCADLGSWGQPCTQQTATAGCPSQHRRSSTCWPHGTWDVAADEGHDGSGDGPQADAGWQHLAAADVGVKVTPRDLAQGVAPEEGALHQARHRRRPAEVLRHGYDRHADVDLHAQVLRQACRCCVQPS